MRDNLLFQYIRSVVRQKHGNSNSSELVTFAERYCRQQLTKKKLNTYNSHQKMTHLMQNFRHLDTYVDLPQLIQSVKKWKLTQMQSSQTPEPPCIIKQEKSNETVHTKIKKQLGDNFKQKYLIQNGQVDQVLNFLQKNTNIRSDGLKNNSSNNLNQLFQAVSEEGDDQTWKGNFDFIQLLNSPNPLDRLKIERNLSVNFKQKIRDSSLNSKLRREDNDLLHKVTTYLQIILQTQHKQKWDNKFRHNSQDNFSAIEDKSRDKKTINLKSPLAHQEKQFILGNSNIIIHQINKETDKQVDNKMFRQKKLKKSPFMHRKNRSQAQEVFRNSESDCLTKTNTQFSEEQDKDLPENMSISQQSLQQNSSQIHPSWSNKQNLLNKRNGSFCRTTSSFNIRTQTTLKQFPSYAQRRMNNNSPQLQSPFNSKKNRQIQNSRKSQLKLKQTFTFRNRNKKQKILNKLSQFIREIDQQEHTNKKQNNYYNNAINKLQNTLSLSFGQFQQQVFIGDADIENLKKYAGYYCNGGRGVEDNRVKYWKEYVQLNERHYNSQEEVIRKQDTDNSKGKFGTLNLNNL